MSTLPSKPIVDFPSEDERLLGGWGWLLAAMCLFNFFVFPFLRATGGGGRGVFFLGALAVGLFPAQLGALTLWLVWGPGPLAARLARHWLAVLALYAAWALGAGITLSDGPPNAVPSVWGAVLCSLPLVSLASQLPLWPLRTHLGWRVERVVRSPGEPQAESSTKEPLLIRDILIGTAATAVALTGIRVVAAIVDAQQPGGQVPPGWWFGWGVGVLIFAAISLLGFLPATWLLLRGSEPAPRLALWLGYVAVAAMIIVAVIASISGGRADAEPFVGLLCLAASFAGALAVPLLLARSHGWRLVLPGDPPIQPPGEPPARRRWPGTESVATRPGTCDIPSKEPEA